MYVRTSIGGASRHWYKGNMWPKGGKHLQTNVATVGTEGIQAMPVLSQYRTGTWSRILFCILAR